MRHIVSSNCQDFTMKVTLADDFIRSYPDFLGPGILEGCQLHYLSRYQELNIIYDNFLIRARGLADASK